MAYLGNTIINGNLKVVNGINVSGNLTGNVTGNCSGTAANVTGTVAIAHGGTGATTRLAALQALTNENVSTSAQYFLTITSNWGKGGYTTVADAKTVLGLGSAAYTASTAYAAASHTHSYLPLAGGTLTGAINTANNVWNKMGDDSAIGDHNVGGHLCIKGLNATPGITFFNSSDANLGNVIVNNEFNFNKTIKQNGTAVALSGHTHSYLPLAGGTLTGVLTTKGGGVSWIETVNNANGCAIEVPNTGAYGWIRGKTKNGKIVISTYANSDDRIYIGYAETGRTTNSYTRQIYWDGSNGSLTMVGTSGTSYIQLPSGIKLY